MKYVLVVAVVSLIFLTCAQVPAQEDDDRLIIINPESYMPHLRPFEEPIPLDRTLRLMFKVAGPEGEKTVTLLSATTVYGIETGKSEEDNFSIGGTLRMVRSTEVLVTFDFEVSVGELTMSGSGSVKIRLGEQKVFLEYGDYTLSIHVELDSD